MKLKTLYMLLLAFFVLVMASCDDTVKEVGFTIQPEKDGVSVGSDTLQLTASTMQVDKIFAKTKSPVLGEYVDPVYGTIKSDYVGEFYFPEGLAFESGSVIDSVELAVSYLSWVGDSLAPMQITAYEVTKKLPSTQFYTDFSPAGYYDPTKILGQHTYSVKSSEHQTYSSASDIRYIMSIKLPDNRLGQRMLDNPQSLKNPEAFNDFFKGVYITTTFGAGTVFNVEATRLFVHYHYPGKTKDGKSDSTYVSTLGVGITPEVSQINSIQNENSQLLTPNSEYTYLKSPAGVITEITFPFSQIADKLESQALNLAQLTIQTVPDNSTQKFKLSPPPAVLLINKDSLNGFFEKRMMYNNLTTFYATLDSKYQYNFPNLSSMVNYYKELAADKNEKLSDMTYLLVPIAITYTTQTDMSGSQQQTPSTISNLMTPAAATISKKPEDLKMSLIFSKF